MRHVLITNTKGGVGKTTTAVYLAAALTRHGTVELWDTDPQASASEWSYRVADQDRSLPFTVRPMNAAQLHRTDAAADFVVIDTGPGDWASIDAGLRLADAAVLPTTPSGMDLDRLWATERIASQHCPSYVLLTLADGRSKAPTAALQALDDQGVGYFETTIPNRQAIRASYGNPLPTTQLFGYEHVAQELKEAMQW